MNYPNLTRRSVLFFCAILLSLNNHAQKKKLDSLWNIWQDNNKVDSLRLIAIKKFIWDGYLYTQPDSAFYFAQLQYEFALRKNMKGKMADALNTLGASNLIRSNYPQALEYFQKSYDVYEEMGNKLGTASALTNIGLIYDDLGEYNQAIGHHQKSLVICQELGNKEGISAALSNIGNVYNRQGNYPKALQYYQETLSINNELGDKRSSFISLNNIGTIYNTQGYYTKALEYFKKCLAIQEEQNDKLSIATLSNNIGIIYENQRVFSEALEYYKKSVIISQELGDKKGVAIALNNVGNIHALQDNYKLAKEYLQKSLIIREELNDKQGVAQTLENIGLVYLRQGNNSQALDYFQKSLTIREGLGEKIGKANSLIRIGIIYSSQGKYLEALNHCKKSLELGKNSNVLSIQKEACLCLLNTYKSMGEFSKAIDYMELMHVVEDSLKVTETTNKLQQMEFEKEMLEDSIAKAEEARLIQMAHQEEIRQKNNTRNWSIAGGVFAFLLAGGFFSRWRYVRKSRDIISKEKDRSENLLLNILPAEIAEELKEKGRADARDFEMVSILFTDFKGFTEASEKLSAQDLVTEINTCFEAFDDIMGKYGIEKIKTIGDAYMAAGGLPIPSDESVKNTVLAALEMQEFASHRKASLDAQGKPGFEMRVGIHTGPVVAGIVGVKKFQYDVWGDTVNTASRMESSGEVGQVNISETTYDLIKDDDQFTFESRGKIKAKGKGELDMYFVFKT